MIGTSLIPQQVLAYNINSKSIPTSLQAAFTFASLLFLVIISLERTYALIWPLRHRVASTRGYIYSVIFVWMAGISAGGLTLLAEYKILDLLHWAVILSSTIVVSLISICVSYLTIRTRLNCRVRAIDLSVHNRQNAPDQRAKLARTMFIVIAASLICFLPSTVSYLIHYLCSKCVILPLSYVFNVLYLGNSLVNPIIYSFRIPIKTYQALQAVKTI